MTEEDRYNAEHDLLPAKKEEDSSGGGLINGLIDGIKKKWNLGNPAYEPLEEEKDTALVPLNGSKHSGSDDEGSYPSEDVDSQRAPRSDSSDSQSGDAPNDTTTVKMDEEKVELRHMQIVPPDPVVAAAANKSEKAKGKEKATPVISTSSKKKHKK